MIVSPTSCRQSCEHLAHTFIKEYFDEYISNRNNGNFETANHGL